MKDNQFRCQFNPINPFSSYLTIDDPEQSSRTIYGFPSFGFASSHYCLFSFWSFPRLFLLNLPLLLLFYSPRLYFAAFLAVLTLFGNLFQGAITLWLKCLLTSSLAIGWTRLFIPAANLVLAGLSSPIFWNHVSGSKSSLPIVLSRIRIKLPVCIQIRTRIQLPSSDPDP